MAGASGSTRASRSMAGRRRGVANLRYCEGSQVSAIYSAAWRIFERAGIAKAEHRAFGAGFDEGEDAAVCCHDIVGDDQSEPRAAIAGRAGEGFETGSPGPCPPGPGRCRPLRRGGCRRPCWRSRGDASLRPRGRSGKGCRASGKFAPGRPRYPDCHRRRSPIPVGCLRLRACAWPRPPRRPTHGGENESA